VFSIRAMTLADVPAGMELKAQAGWNQLEADWKRLLELSPEGAFIAEVGDRPVGTVATCRFGPVAWVAMMLVDEAHRGRGIGRALMNRALEHLDAQGVRSIRLDATPLGEPLYASLGFAAETTFARYQGDLPGISGSGRLGKVHAAESPEDVAALDREVTGTDRRRLLDRLASEYPGSLRVFVSKRRIRGYLLSRPGAQACQIGPCIADAEGGLALFVDAARRYPGRRVLIDIPTSHATATSLVEGFGLTVARRLTRMGRGPRVNEDLERLWASAGPEKG
jgi:GNAT superfamily N-acetyltransferase